MLVFSFVLHVSFENLHVVLTFWHILVLVSVCANVCVTANRKWYIPQIVSTPGVRSVCNKEVGFVWIYSSGPRFRVRYPLCRVFFRGFVWEFCRCTVHSKVFVLERRVRSREVSVWRDVFEKSLNLHSMTEKPRAILRELQITRKVPCSCNLNWILVGENCAFLVLPEVFHAAIFFLVYLWSGSRE